MWKLGSRLIKIKHMCCWCWCSRIAPAFGKKSCGRRMKFEQSQAGRITPMDTCTVLPGVLPPLAAVRPLTGQVNKSAGFL